MHTREVKVSLEELPFFVKELLVWLPVSAGATVLALSGELGAGKTAFVKNLATALGVTENVASPTFTILKGYQTSDDTWRQLLHMDAYRIDDLDELRPLRFIELLGQAETIFCIEWAEKITEALPENCTWIQFVNTEEDDVRIVRISGAGVNG